MVPLVSDCERRGGALVRLARCAVLVARGEVDLEVLSVHSEADDVAAVSCVPHTKQRIEVLNGGRVEPIGDRPRAHETIRAVRTEDRDGGTETHDASAMANREPPPNRQNVLLM